MATVVPFPKTHRIRQGLVIPLYNDDEIEATLAAVNLHGPTLVRYTPETIDQLDADTVRVCLQLACTNQLLSSRTRELIRYIIANIEPVSIRRKK